MESVIFLEAGAWKSIEELEDILTLEELSVLYKEAVDKEKRFVKIVAAALGAEFPDDEEESEAQMHSGSRTYNSETGGYVPSVITNNHDASMLPISVGYESSL